MKILDLFCGAGGASKGYANADFEVVGVDIKKQPHYPFEFIQSDWEEALRILPGLWEREKIPFAIHASPPCQRYSKLTKKWGLQDNHPDLIAKVREELKLLKVPYIIENIEGAPLENPILLCGSMFNLGIPERNGELRRHRLFESNFEILAPKHPKHTGRSIGVYGHTGGKSNRDDITFWSAKDWQVAMQIDWMNRNELAQAIPPAYTEYIGLKLFEKISPIF